jgi:hypothetical protein
MLPNWNLDGAPKCRHCNCMLSWSFSLRRWVPVSRLGRTDCGRNPSSIYHDPSVGAGSTKETR